MTRRRDLTQRALDVVVSGALLLLSAPVWPVVWVAIRLDSPGPVLFRGRRMGRHGAEFAIFKLRSMRVEAPESGLAITVGGDPRVTRVGRVLRRTKLDELPQLLNVLRGEMSLVGWRPEDPRYRPFYDGDMEEIFEYRPGITSPASLEMRDEEAILARLGGDDPEAVYVRELLPAKVARDLAYCRSATVRSDLGVLLQTAGAVLRRR